MSDDNSGFSGGFALPLPPEIGAMFEQQRDRARMSQSADEAKVETFLTGLTPEQLVALRLILNAGDIADSKAGNYWDGQIVGLLEYLHRVDPRTGEDPMDALKDEA